MVGVAGLVVVVVTVLLLRLLLEVVEELLLLEVALLLLLEILPLLLVALAVIDLDRVAVRASRRRGNMKRRERRGGQWTRGGRRVDLFWLVS